MARPKSGTEVAFEPSGMEEITRAARVVKPDTVVWRGDPLLPFSQQGVKVLGIPIGHTEYVREFLERKTRQQEVLLQRIPSVNDTQAAFFLLTMCDATRANFWLLAVKPCDSARSLHFVIGGRWSGSGKCSSRACRSSLGELGGFSPDDQTTAPSHCKVDGQTIGGPRTCWLFPVSTSMPEAIDRRRTAPRTCGGATTEDGLATASFAEVGGQVHS